MTIYQWIFFDRGDDMTFTHFEGTDKEKVNREAYNFYYEYLQMAVEEDELNTATATTYEEFVSDDLGFVGAHYIDCYNIGGLECCYNEINI